jgi:hypothetical protein
MLFYTDVSFEKGVVLVLVLIGFTFVIAVTLLRLVDLAKKTGLIRDNN